MLAHLQTRLLPRSCSLQEPFDLLSCRVTRGLQHFMSHVLNSHALSQRRHTVTPVEQPEQHELAISHQAGANEGDVVRCTFREVVGPIPA